MGPLCRILCLIWGLGVACGAVSAQEQAPSDPPVEVLIDGKSYPSMRAYQRDRLKRRMREALSGVPLEEFDVPEVTSIIEELRREQAVSPGNDKGEEMRLMEEMLKGYKEGHPRTPGLMLDPQKMKTITVP